MIVSFFGRGTGGGSGPVDYLLGKERDREHAQLLSGDPNETAALIDGSNYEKKYTSGVLSFEEANITDEQKRQLMNSFEECLFPSLEKNQYNVLWVEHTDKGRLELNFVIPNIELTTGKRLQPYYHAADFKRVDAWQTINNIEHGLSDPHDPSKRQTLTQAKDLPRNKQEALQAINEGVLSLAKVGVIKSRQDVLQALEGAGFEVARQTKTSISVKDPDGGRNIRLTGALYEQNFGLSQDLQRDIEERSRQFKASIGDRLKEARERYQYGIEQKQRELEKRYSSKQRSVAARDRIEPQAHELDGIQVVGVADRLAVSSVSGADDLERLTRLDDIRTKTDYSGRQKDVGGAARGLPDSERGESQLHRAGVQESDEARSLSNQIGRMGYQGREQINDRSRETITRHVEALERDEDERAKLFNGLLKRLGGTAGQDHRELEKHVSVLKQQDSKLRENARRTTYIVDAAKQVFNRVVRAAKHVLEQVVRAEMKLEPKNAQERFKAALEQTKEQSQKQDQERQQRPSRGFGMSR